MTQKEPQFILVNFPISKYKSVDFEKCKEDFENEDPIGPSFYGWMPHASDYEKYFYSSFDFNKSEVNTIVISYLCEITNELISDEYKEQIIEALTATCKEVDNGA